jgi:hypothetical protein
LNLTSDHAVQKNTNLLNLASDSAVKSAVVNTTVQNLARNAFVEPFHKHCRRTAAAVQNLAKHTMFKPSSGDKQV